MPYLAFLSSFYCSFGTGWLFFYITFLVNIFLQKLFVSVLCSGSDGVGGGTAQSRWWDDGIQKEPDNKSGSFMLFVSKLCRTCAGFGIIYSALWYDLVRSLAHGLPRFYGA